MKKQLYIALTTVAFAWLLAACSADEPVQQQPEKELETAHLQLNSVTRAPDMGMTYADIQVYLTNPDEGVTSGEFKYMGMRTVDNVTFPEWSAEEVKLKAGTRTYHLYGFMPANIEGVTPTFNAATGTLTLAGLDVMTSQDICIITGVEKSTAKVTPTRGLFSFEYKNTETFTYLNLLFDHLYGQLQFKFQLGAQYSKLRKVKLKNVQVKALKTGKVKAEIPLSPFNLNGIVFTPSTADSDQSVTLVDTDKWVTTTSELVGTVNFPIHSIFQNTFELVSTYEVYDLKDQLLSTRTATNKLGAKMPRRGQKNVVDLLVEPTFLYQLSDNDLDNPTVKIQ